MPVAQFVRFAVALISGVIAVLAFLKLSPGWAAWAALVAIFVVGGSMAEWLFRRLASREQIRDDLEDRVRNPPS
jgi:uncharacterized membrane protein